MLVEQGNEDVVRIAHFAMSMKFALAWNTNNNTEMVMLQMDINDLKKLSISYMDSIISRKNITSSINVVNEYMKVQIYNSSLEIHKEINSFARENELPVIDYTNCEAKLKRYYNVTTNLLVKQVYFPPKVNFSIPDENISGSVMFQFYDALTKKLLNHTEHCKNEKILISIKPEVLAKNATTFQFLSRMAKKGIDIFNYNSTAFQSKCFAIENDTGEFATINLRIRDVYQNKTVSCGENCEYVNTDIYGYFQCNCTPSLPEAEYRNELRYKILQYFPIYNYQIIFCYRETFRYPEIFYNTGFLIIASFIVATLVGGVIFSRKRIEIPRIKMYLHEVLRFDARFFNCDEILKTEYFEDENFFDNPENNITPPHAQAEGDALNKIQFLSKKENAGAECTFQDKTPASPVTHRKSRNSIMIPLNKILNEKDKETEKEKEQNMISPSSHFPFKPITMMSDEKINKKNNEIPNLKCSDDLSDMSLGSKKDVQKLTFTTLQDLAELSQCERIKYDKRSFGRLFMDILLKEHIVIWLFYNKSLLKPIWFRINAFLFSLIIIFTANALMYWEDYIEARAAAKPEERVKIISDKLYNHIRIHFNIFS